MKTLAKGSLVLLGYVLAWLIACGVLALHQWLTAADSQGADGMYAFGDGLLFLGVFGLLALVVSAVAVYFLRPGGSFWTGLTVVALAVGATAPLAAALFAAPHWMRCAGALGVVSGLALLRLFLSPLLLCAFTGTGLLVSAAPLRRRLFIAGGLEALALAAIVLFWALTRY